MYFADHVRDTLGSEDHPKKSIEKCLTSPDHPIWGAIIELLVGIGPKRPLCGCQRLYQDVMEVCLPCEKDAGEWETRSQHGKEIQPTLHLSILLKQIV